MAGLSFGRAGPGATSALALPVSAGGAVFARAGGALLGTGAVFERFVGYRRFGGALAFTHDGTHVLYVSNMSGQFNLWRVSVDGGWPDQLTAFTENTVRQIAVSRDDRIVLTADHDGDEFHQLYLLDPAVGWPEQITNEPEAQHFVGSGAFSPDGKSLAYSANARSTFVPTSA